MIAWDQLTIIFFLINISVIIWIVLAYFIYKKYYIPKFEKDKPDIEKGFRELFDNFSKGISESFKDIKIPFDLEEITNKMTEQFFGTFLTVLGVVEEYDEKWSFRDYIGKIIDSSVESIVPETIKQFENILPEFADSFIEGIQKALTGAVSDLPEGSPEQAVAQQGMPDMGKLDIGKIIQLYIAQMIMKQMGGGGLGGLLGGLGGAAGAPQSGPSGF